MRALASWAALTCALVGCAEGGVELAGVTAERWVVVAAGSYRQGTPPEERCRDADEVQRDVQLTRPLKVAVTEVTQARFEALRGYNPSFLTGCPECPVESVTWHEAASWCNARSSASALQTCYVCQGEEQGTRCVPAGEGQCAGYRLPTEAEWEYLARAGTGSALPTGGVQSCMTQDRAMDRSGWYKVNSGGRPHPVGTLGANPWGLEDMAGNVYEWVHDAWAQRGVEPAVDPVVQGSEESERVLRGGSWYHNAEHARAGSRERFSASRRFSFVGFRCVRSL